MYSDPCFPGHGRCQYRRQLQSDNNPYKFVDPDGRQSQCQATACQVVDLIKNISNGTDAISSRAEVVSQKMEKVDVRLEGAVALGAGVEVSVSLLRGDGDVAFIPVGQGADISISLQPREGYSFNFADKPVSAPLKFQGGMEIKGGAILHGGAEGVFNPGGSIEVVPKVGIGVGELVKYSPAISFIEWGKQNKKTDE